MILPKSRKKQPNKKKFCGKCGKRTMKQCGVDGNGIPIFRCKCGYTWKPQSLGEFIDGKTKLQTQRGIHNNGDNNKERSPETGNSMSKMRKNIGEV